MDVRSGSLEGFKEFMDILEELGDEKQINKLLRSTNREILKPVSKQYKSLPFSKRLLKNIKIGAAKVDGSKHPNALVAGPSSDSFVLRFLNTGTKERYTKTGAYRGRITGKNRIEPFLDREALRIQDNVVTEYGENLVKVIGKKVKRIKK